MKKVFSVETRQLEMARKGYTIVPMFTRDQAQGILQDVRKLIPAGEPASTGPGNVQLSFHATFLDSDIPYKIAAAALLEVHFAPLIHRILVDYRIMISGLFLKSPGTGQIGLHRDWTLTRDLDDINITVWCPLVDCNETNGTLQVIAGSHRVVANVEGPGSQPFFSGFAEALKKRSTRLSLRAGEAIFFDSSLLHWSDLNRSASTRYAVSVFCVPPDATPAFFYPEPKTAGKRFEVFEMDREAFVRNSLQDYHTGKLRAKSLGYVDNRNRLVSQAAFEQMLDGE